MLSEVFWRTLLWVCAPPILHTVWSVQCVFPEPTVTANSLKFNTRTFTGFVAGESWGCHFSWHYQGFSWYVPQYYYIKIRVYYCTPDYSLDGQIIKGIKKWLEDQVQKVEVNDSYSNWSLVTSGMAQGSVLGSFLFNIFIEEWEVRVCTHISKGHQIGRTCQ